MDWLSELNQAQRAAVTSGDGPLLIIAGPGTGKTKTLTYRIGYLLASGRAAPSEILALTFTNKAAEEMRARVIKLRGATDMPAILTFHGLGYQLLSGYHQAIRFISEPERLLLIKELKKAATLKGLTTRELGLELSRLKNRPLGEKVDDPVLQGLLQHYNQALQARELFDFDDLLQKVHQLLTEQPRTMPYKYILVDEFQDTNRLQYQLLRLLNVADNLCAIGDPLQSIYGFRGAGSDVFKHFLSDFPASQTITLTTNYRSVPEVVRLANELYPEAPNLEAFTKQTGEVQAVEVLNEYSEARWIIDRIEQAVGGSDFLRSHQHGYDGPTKARTFKDFAILYRTHNAARPLKKLLAESGIPFQVIGDGLPYERPEIWATMQIMCYLADPSDDRENRLAPIAALKKLSPLQRERLLDGLKKKLPMKISELAQTIIDQFGFSKNHTQEFISPLLRFDDQDLTAYSRYVDALEEANFYDPTADMVTLMTIHGAKGLEFSHVFLIAVEEDRLPYKRSGGEADSDEEKRLFYVAVTRAREDLDILYAKNRSGCPATVSRFIKELDGSVLPRHKDQTMHAEERRLAKRRIKQSQATLFDL